PRGDRVPVQEMDAVPQPRGTRATAARGPSAPAQGVPAELPGLLQGVARLGRQGPGRLPPDAHRRARGPGPRHLPHATTATAVRARGPTGPWFGCARGFHAVRLAFLPAQPVDAAG